MLAAVKVSCQGALKLLHTQDIILSNGCFSSTKWTCARRKNGAYLMN